MQERAHAIWVIFFSFFVAYLLAIVPFPEPIAYGQVIRLAPSLDDQ